MIACFGASVTQQKNGYCDKLSKKIDEKIHKYGYGGMHICDAGICFIDKVLKAKPNICILDWFSTDYQNDDGLIIEYIKTIVQKLNAIDCRVIFLFLPNRNTFDWQLYYSKLESDLNNLQLEFISVYKLLSDYDKDLLLRDTIHTTEYGAELYAECIFDYLNKSQRLQNNIIEKTKYSKIKKLNVKQVFKKQIMLNGNAEILGFYNIIGKYSGLVRLRLDSEKDGIINIWDEWSYYPRYHFNLRFILRNNCSIDILQDSFDTSICEKEIDFSIYRKYIVLDTIYFIGDKIDLITKGSKISYRIKKLESFISRLLHLFYRILTIGKKIIFRLKK